MLDLLKSNVLAPLATRLGTLATGGLLGIGANATHADWVGTGIAGGFLIAMDLGLAWLRKKRIQNKVPSADQFASWLTVQPTVFAVGASEPVYPVIEALDQFRKVVAK